MVRPPKDNSSLLSLSVVIECHGEHVEPDEHHDDHVELLVGHDAEHNRLGPPLKKKYSYIFQLIYIRLV